LARRLLRGLVKERTTMTTSTTTRKLTSILSTFAACLGLAVGASGCFVGTDPYYGDVVVVGDPLPDTVVVVDDPAIAQETIDADVTMDYKPGDGVGLYVEYSSGGHWHVFTTCDTKLTDLSCAFDVVIRPEAGSLVSKVGGYDLAAGDSVGLTESGAVRLLSTTTLSDQGVDFDLDPGALVEIDFLLDGAPQPQFVYAVSHGLVLNGVATNPVQFIPASF
jgi:hypothetical protein